MCVMYYGRSCAQNEKRPDVARKVAVNLFMTNTVYPLNPFGPYLGLCLSYIQQKQEHSLPLDKSSHSLLREREREREREKGRERERGREREKEKERERERKGGREGGKGRGREGEGEGEEEKGSEGGREREREKGRGREGEGEGEKERERFCDSLFTQRPIFNYTDNDYHIFSPISQIS